MSYTPLKSILNQAGLLTPAQCDRWSEAWRRSVESGGTEPRLAFFAREAGLAEEAFLQKLASALSLEFIDLAKLSIAPEIRKRISTKVAFQFSIIPFLDEGGVLVVAVADPFDAAMLASVQFDVGGAVRYALATRAEIEKALKKYYGVGAETLDEMAEEDDAIELEIDGGREITGDDQDASVIKFVNQVIWEAFKDRATDIHFEPSEDELRIRYRIDGILHQTPLPPQIKRYQAALISRIKVRAGMNIAV